MPRKRKEETQNLGKSGRKTKIPKITVDDSGLKYITYAQKLKRKKDQSEKEKEEEKIPSHDCCEVDAANTLLGLKPRALPFTINVARPSYTISSNLTLQLHGYTMGIPRKNLYKSATKCVIDMLSDMQISTMTSPFNRRVTAMDWHPTNPDVVVVGSKGGDVFWWDTSNIEKQKFHQGLLVLQCGCSCR